MNKKVVGIASPFSSIGSFYMWKQVQKHEKTSQQETEQGNILMRKPKPTIHVFDDNKFVFVAQRWDRWDSIQSRLYFQFWMSIKRDQSKYD
ncbi:MAG: hypothetical protein ACLT8H_10020 [Streptococcus parasanguinis]